MKTSLTFFPLLAALLLTSCSAPKEEIPPPKEERKSVPTPTEKPVRTFAINDRYYVRNAVLAPPTQIDDPLQAIRVIQIKSGANETLVLFRSEEVMEKGESVRYETWLGIEMPSFATGSYDISSAKQLQFFRFLLVKNGVRYDGKIFSGKLVIEGVEEGYLIGSIDVTVKGETKSFDTSPDPFTYSWSGDFRVRDVPLDATIMK